MKVLHSNRGRNILVVILAVALLATVGGVRPSRAQLHAGPIIIGPDPSGSPAFFDIFLEIEGVEGEAAAPGHERAIEVLSWSWGVSQTATGGGGGAGGLAGREKTGHVTLIKRIDKATPLLSKRCVEGTVAPRVTVHLTREEGQTYLKYELKEVLVSSVQHGGDLDGDGLLDETLELTFDGAKLTYTPHDPAGKPVGQISAEW
jgi:type VI secretion system secreted protein Hcp